MCELIKKLGTIILTASLLEIASYQLHPLPSQGQEPELTSCEPRVTTGTAKCNYENGDNYVGQIVNSLPEGNGIYVYANGDRYEGQFRQGRPNGQGDFIFANDARYVGVIQNGVMRRGIVFFSNVYSYS